MKMTNHWNQFIYRLWAPIYDATVNRIFMRGRRRALQLLDLQPREQVLIVGIGTGADLPFLPPGVEATGIDLSPEMLSRARLKRDRCRASVQFIEGDAQTLVVEPDSFDAAILNLILSVVPDGNACLRAACRALKPGGRAVIFDKFLPEGQQLSLPRKFMNFFTTLFGTDINRRLSDIMTECPCSLTYDEPSIGGGMYHAILLNKN